MSSLPEIFKSNQSAYIKPEKQGGIFALKYQQNVEDYSTIQPQQFYSVKISKYSQSRVGTSHTIRSQKKVSFIDCRNVTTSSTNRRGSSRNVQSRGSTREVRKDIYTNYGNSRATYAIGQSVPMNFQQAESLIHKLNQGIQQMRKCQALYQQTVQHTSQIKSQIKRLNNQFNQQIKQIESTTRKQTGILKNLLSDLRRCTGMEQKVNKTDLAEISQNLQIISTVLNEVDDKSADLHQTCIK